jgi:hypothetical protein
MLCWNSNRTGDGLRLNARGCVLDIGTKAQIEGVTFRLSGRLFQCLRGRIFTRS